jgi:hypothetical protein
MQWSEVATDRRRPGAGHAITVSTDRQVRRLVWTIAFRMAVTAVRNLAQPVEIAFRDAPVT